MADAISSFLADPFEMEKWGVDGMITGSQKALACPPEVPFWFFQSGRFKESRRIR